MRVAPSAALRRAFVAAAFAVTLGTPGRCLATPSASDQSSLSAWSSTVSAGDKTALCRLAGISEEIEDARLPLELIRVVHGERLTGGDPVDRTRTALVFYLSTLEGFARALGASPPPGLSTAIARLHPGDLRAVMTLLGLGFDGKSAAPWRDLPHRSDAVREALSRAGLPLQNLTARLNQGEIISLRLSRTTVPLPLTPAAWREVVMRDKVRDEALFPAIMRDRTAALVYHGLASLDGETLRYFGNHWDLLSLARQHPGAFAATARSIHVRGGRVLVPGGAGAESLWVALADASPAEATGFIRALLHQTGGKLAYFYDAIAHLAPSRQRFALGLAGDHAPDTARFRALYDAFVGAVPSWSIEEHPFTRPTSDGLTLFTLLGVDDGGRLAPPASEALWRCALGEGTIAAGEEPTGPIAEEPAADAAAIAGLVLRPGPGLQRAQRLKAVLFAQRVFGRAHPLDAPAVCAAVRPFGNFDALALVLERIGVDDPRTYVAAMRRASSLSDLTNAHEGAVALSQFQGALALVDRLVFQETFDAAEGVRLVRSLVQLPLSDHGYAGAVATWLRRDMLPAIRRAMRDSTTTGDEDALLEGLAGSRPVVAAPPTPLDWEGQRYRVDPANAELARLSSVRRKQAGNRLDDPFALHATADALGRPGLAAAERRRLLDQLAGLVHVRPSVDSAVDGDAEGSLTRSMARAAEASARFASSPESETRRAALVERVSSAADEMLAAVLRSLAYAAAIGTPDTNLFLGPDVAQDHDFGGSDSRWAIAVEQAGAGAPWHLRGSLLALEVPLAPYSLRRVSSDQPLAPRRLDSDDEQGLALSAVLKRPWALTDVGRDHIVALVRAGREEAAAAATPDARQALFDAANVSEWRRNVLDWGPNGQRPSLETALTLTELLWIGARRQRVVPPDAWGMSMVALSGCLCLRMMGPGSIDSFGIHASLGTMSSYIADPTLRVAELTAELNLPAALVAPLLTGITQDVLDLAQPAHGNDWLEYAQAARRMTRERFEDQVAALTVAGGPLVPAEISRF